MKKLVIVSVSVLSLAVMAAPGICAAKKAEKIDAKAKFDQHCVACHPKGGNIIRPDKTLSKKSLETHGIKTEKDIVAKMRNPGAGMTKFDAKAVPEAEATAIAKYILATFK